MDYTHYIPDGYKSGDDFDAVTSQADFDAAVSSLPDEILRYFTEEQGISIELTDYSGVSVSGPAASWDYGIKAVSMMRDALNRAGFETEIEWDSVVPAIENEDLMRLRSLAAEMLEIAGRVEEKQPYDHEHGESVVASEMRVFTDSLMKKFEKTR